MMNNKIIYKLEIHTINQISKLNLVAFLNLKLNLLFFFLL